MISAADHRAALAIRCCLCGAGPGLRCTGIRAHDCGHAARWHDPFVGDSRFFSSGDEQAGAQRV